MSQPISPRDTKSNSSNRDPKFQWPRHVLAFLGQIPPYIVHVQRRSMQHNVTVSIVKARVGITGVGGSTPCSSCLQRSFLSEIGFKIHVQNLNISTSDPRPYQFQHWSKLSRVCYRPISFLQFSQKARTHLAL